MKKKNINSFIREIAAIGFNIRNDKNDKESGILLPICE